MNDQEIEKIQKHKLSFLKAQESVKNEIIIELASQMELSVAEVRVIWETL